MPQTVIWLTSEKDKQLKQQAKVWNISKSDTLMKIINMYFDEGAGSELEEPVKDKPKENGI